MTDALLVNPYDIGSIARSLEQALTTPLAERQARHAKSLATLRCQDIHRWRTRFVAALEKAKTPPVRPS